MGSGQDGGVERLQRPSHRDGDTSNCRPRGHDSVRTFSLLSNCSEPWTVPRRTARTYHVGPEGAPLLNILLQPLLLGLDKGHFLFQDKSKNSSRNECSDPWLVRKKGRGKLGYRYNDLARPHK